MKKRSPLKKQSAKEAKVKAIYRRICKEMDDEMMEEHGYHFCKSCHCNASTAPLGHSHNLPKSMFKSLETDPDNIDLRCQNFGNHEGCHEKLDSNDIEAIVKFKDFDEIMAYRYDNAPEEYNKLVSAILVAGLETNHTHYEENISAEESEDGSFYQ